MEITVHHVVSLCPESLEVLRSLRAPPVPVAHPASAPTPPAPTPPAPTPPAPTPPAPTPPGTTPPAGQGLDSAGSAVIPWDGRIHSGGKTLKQNGQWTQKRGVTAGLVAQVEAELRGAAATGAMTTTPLAPAPSHTYAQVLDLLVGLADTVKMNEILLAEGVENIHGLRDRPDLFAQIATAVAVSNAAAG